MFVHVFGDCCHVETLADGAPLSWQCFLTAKTGKPSVAYHTVIQGFCVEVTSILSTQMSSAE